MAVIVTDNETFTAHCHCGESLRISIPEVGLWSDHESAALAEAGWTERDSGGYRCDECQPAAIPCCQCGKLTTYDPIYQNLCYRCIRCESE